MAACLLTSSLTLAPATAASADGRTRLKAKFVASLVARHSDKCLDVYGLDVLPREVCDAADGWLAFQRGVSAVMVVHVQPGIKSGAAFGL